jgi:hypothetical protein
MGMEVMVLVVGCLMTLVSGMAMFTLRGLRDDLHELKQLVARVIEDGHTKEVANESRLGKAEAELEDHERRIGKVETRLDKHLIDCRHGT